MWNIRIPICNRFLPVYSGEFSSTGHTSQIRPISIILSGCNLIDGDGEHLAIKVNGEMAKFDSSLFLNSQETTASGVGIMLLPENIPEIVQGFISLNGLYVMEVIATR